MHMFLSSLVTALMTLSVSLHMNMLLKDPFMIFYMVKNIRTLFLFTIQKASSEHLKSSVND